MNLTSLNQNDTLTLKSILGVNMGSIREQFPGLWRVTFYWKGQRFDIYKNKYGEKLETERQAALTLAHIESQIKNKNFDPAEWSADRPFLFEKACKLWLELKTTSDNSRERIANKHLIPYWGKFDIREIRSIHLQEFLKQLRNKGLSDKTIYNIMSELRACLRFHRDSIPQLPTFPTITIQEKPIRWLTSEQQDRIFQEIPEVHKPIFTFLRYTGCRPSEARALQRKDVSWETRTISISKAMGENGIIKDRTKTKKIKVLPISQMIEWTLKPREATPFIFSFRGEPYKKRQMERIWNRACEKAGIKINMYNGLKHSFGCQRLNQGFTLDQIKEVMGHADKRTTERYARYLTQSLAEVMDGCGRNVVRLENKNK